MLLCTREFASRRCALDHNDGRSSVALDCSHLSVILLAHTDTAALCLFRLQAAVQTKRTLCPSVHMHVMYDRYGIENLGKKKSRCHNTCVCTLASFVSRTVLVHIPQLVSWRILYWKILILFLLYHILLSLTVISTKVQQSSKMGSHNNRSCK